MSVLGLAESTGYVIVGVVTAAFLLAGTVYANRVRREVAKIGSDAQRTESLQTGQASLIDDLQTDRTELRKQVADLRSEVQEARLEGHENRREISALKLQARETERALLDCRESERELRAEIVELKR